MKLADLRVVRADIPVQRPHKMSFTTLEAVNFVFVRLATSDGHVGWGEAAWIARGHRTFKIKTGAGALADDVERLRRLREALGSEISLRVDANQGWDRPTALRAVRALEPYALDFVEQPVPRWDLEGLALIAERASMPIMADESCFTDHEALALARRGSISILSLKLTKSGGLLGSLAIARVAEAAGMGCYVGCMIETSLGTAAYLHLALAAAPVTWGCELFGPLLLAGDGQSQVTSQEHTSELQSPDQPVS